MQWIFPDEISNNIIYVSSAVIERSVLFLDFGVSAYRTGEQKRYGSDAVQLIFILVIWQNNYSWAIGLILLAVAIIRRRRYNVTVQFYRLLTAVNCPPGYCF
jgi:hypothetical protein